MALSQLPPHTVAEMLTPLIDSIPLLVFTVCSVRMEQKIFFAQKHLFLLGKGCFLGLKEGLFGEVHILWLVFCFCILIYCFKANLLFNHLKIGLPSIGLYCHFSNPTNYHDHCRSKGIYRFLSSC